MAEYFCFDVSLKGVKPRLFRRFLLKKSATFLDLHEAIQDACGWDDSHLYSFSSPGRRNGFVIADGGMGDDRAEREAPPARKVKLQGYFKLHDKCVYTYDFGDNWEHEVKCKNFALEGRWKRLLLDGTGTFPPEDCGGLPGYHHCLEILSGNVEDDEGIREWLGEWRPDNLDLRKLKLEFDR